MLTAERVTPPLAAAEEREGGGPSGRVVVLGGTEVVWDNYLGGSPNNLNFALNAVDWLAQDEALVSIRAKNRTPPALVFSSNTEQDLVKYFNLIGVPILLVVFAGVRLAKRRQMSRRRYQPSSVSEVTA